MASRQASSNPFGDCAMTSIFRTIAIDLSSQCILLAPNTSVRKRALPRLVSRRRSRMREHRPAYHRLVYAGEDNEEMHRTGSLLVTLATVPLAIGLAGDLYVVIAKIAESNLIGIAAAVAALLLLLGLWYGFPLVMLAARQHTSDRPWSP